MNLPLNRFPSGPAYDSGREPQLECAAKCGYLAYEPDEMQECIVCKKRFCADCMTVLGMEKYCPEHAKCKCGQPALIACDECGSLVCERHMLVDPILNLCAKCGEKARAV
jgi:hypothetical protein